jgi:hypothetical protein
MVNVWLITQYRVVAVAGSLRTHLTPVCPRRRRLLGRDCFPRCFDPLFFQLHGAVPVLLQPRVPPQAVIVQGELDLQHLPNGRYARGQPFNLLRICGE